MLDINHNQKNGLLKIKKSNLFLRYRGFYKNHTIQFFSLWSPFSLVPFFVTKTSCILVGFFKRWDRGAASAAVVALDVVVRASPDVVKVG